MKYLNLDLREMASDRGTEVHQANREMAPAVLQGAVGFNTPVALKIGQQYSLDHNVLISMRAANHCDEPLVFRTGAIEPVQPGTIH
ncbi:MAG: hypothetical protein GWN00_13835 [Aliifodinibius sp.]|nr:hypothetical protein [Fodinibius sp.]NIY25847.1 hypothetical protein [Fodinibius sp.]